MLKYIGTGTTNATPNSDSYHGHDLLAVPEFVIITPRGNGNIYLTVKEDYRITVRCSVASVPFDFMVGIDHSIIK
jgi:hypothetical protein